MNNGPGNKKLNATWGKESCFAGHQSPFFKRSLTSKTSCRHNIGNRYWLQLVGVSVRSLRNIIRQRNIRPFTHKYHSFEYVKWNISCHFHLFICQAASHLFISLMTDPWICTHYWKEVDIIQIFILFKFILVARSEIPILFFPRPFLIR